PMALHYLARRCRPSTEPHSLECGEIRMGMDGGAYLLLQRSRTRWSAESHFPLGTAVSAQPLQRSRTRWSAESQLHFQKQAFIVRHSTEPRSLECGEERVAGWVEEALAAFNGAALVGVRRAIGDGYVPGRWSAFNGAALVGVRRGE